MKAKLPNSVFNLISVAGALLAIISLFTIIFLFIISFLFEQQGSYMGLFIYVIIPPFLVLGLILIPIGMYLKNKREKLHGREETLPIINLQEPAHRNALFIFIIGTLVFVFLTAFGSYEAFHFSESTTFCGELCHQVMNPEFVAYQNSPHARVACVECHVGEGVDWFVKSKLSGVKQVLAVAMNTYPKPIPTPITDLRPARETCEKCHWPEKFYSRTVRLEKHYLTNENNTPWNINLVLKIGGQHSGIGLMEGIHWHVNRDNIVQYVTNDEKRQVIPWVRYINKATGDTTIYINEDDPLEDGELAKLQVREMECIDCHNRPSHIYFSPNKFINQQLASGNIDTAIPEIKAKLIEICEEEFGTLDSINNYARTTIDEFYSNEYPEFYAENKTKIDKAVESFLVAYSQNIFPEMKVKWSNYPSNIGHFEDNGCFRCHSDLHVSSAGRAISKNCDLCHLINAQGTDDNMMIAKYNESLEFQHPEDIGDDWKEVNCIECHTGLNP
ncbi:MAG: NapC/NirT family cytochrome c [Bacteroidetes bacterium]|nr:NapC/NirT family cytochrome c [Bacteroidota bacterium]MBU1680680.1 NapC/NirT family cytochrome c [Bacteroidota bacterium]